MIAPDEIVEAGAEAAEALACVHQAAFPHGERWTTAAIRTLLATPGCFGLVHHAGGMTLCRVAADEAEVLTIGVAPEARRRGIAASLLARASVEAARRGADTLFLEVSTENEAAWALYCRLGFTEAGRRRRYYAGGADAVVMKIRLGARAAAARE